MTTVSSPDSSVAAGRRAGAAAAPSHAPAGRRTQSKGFFWLGLAVLAVGGVAAFGALRGWLPSRQAAPDAASFKVVPRTFPILLNEKGELDALKSVDIKCEVEGRATIIWLIPEGSEVKEGDLLVRMASNEIEEKVRAEEIKAQSALASKEAAEKELLIAIDQHASDIRKAELAVRNAELELQKFEQGDRPQTLLDKQLALDLAKRQLALSESTLEDSRELLEQKFLSKRDFQRDEMAFEEAKVKVKLAEIDLKTYETYTSVKELTTLTSNLDEARKDLERTRAKSEAERAKLEANAKARAAEYNLTAERLAKLRDQQAKTEIRAPAPGLVVYDTGQGRWDRRQITEGAEVYERQTIIKLPDTSRMKVKLRIHEAKTNKIAIGQDATVEVEGVPGQVFRGKVSKVAPLADSQDSWLNPNLKEYDTEVTLDPTSYPLKPGVTARVEIRVKEVQHALAIPVQAVFARQGRQYAFVGRRPASAVPTIVELGDASDQFVQVLSGLKEGDVVLLAADDDMLSRLPNAPVGEEEQPAPGVTAEAGQPQQPPRPAGPRPGAGQGRRGGAGPGGGGSPGGGGGRGGKAS